jgi:hypothetical protein
MTTRSVRSTIQQAMKTQSRCSPALITGREAGKIVKEAEKGVVTVGEAKAIGDVFARGVKLSPGNFMTEMCPETPATTPVLSTAAQGRFDKFFLQHNLPYGAGAASVKQQVRAALDKQGLGDALARKPDTKNLHPVVMHDHRPVDGDKQTAWVDTKSKTFFLQSEGDFRGAGHVDNFFGPFSLEEGPTMHTLAIPEHPGDDAVTRALPENPSDDGGMAVTLAIPENPGDDGISFTMAIPENPGDDGMMHTMAIPESPGDAVFFE